MKVLILEDNQELLFALTQALEDDQHTVHTAANITEATKLIETTHLDLLLLDLLIGCDLSTQVADLAGYRLPHAEVIYLTGSDHFPNGELFEISRNTSWVLRKPVDLYDLKAMVAHVSASAPVRETARA